MALTFPDFSTTKPFVGIKAFASFNLLMEEEEGEEGARDGVELVETAEEEQEELVGSLIPPEGRNWD